MNPDYNVEPPLLSPSGDFAFGFHPLNQTDLLLLSIWFAKVPDKTIVWYAKLDNPAPRGSKVELTADLGLVLTGPQGDELWRPDSIIGTVAKATLCFKIATLISYGRASTIPQILCCLHKIWILEGCFLLDNQRNTFRKEGSNYG